MTKFVKHTYILDKVIHTIKSETDSKLILFLRTLLSRDDFFINGRPGLPFRNIVIVCLFLTNFVLFIFGFVLSFLVGWEKN